MRARALRAGAATFAAALTLAWSAAACAEKGNAPQTAETSYDFDDDLITGDLITPGEDLLLTRRKGYRGSLIRIRESYTPELLRSVERL